jgi:hypothetical protein
VGILVSFEENGKKLEDVKTGVSDATGIDSKITAGLEQKTLKEKFIQDFDVVKKSESFLGRVKHFMMMSF